MAEIELHVLMGQCLNRRIVQMDVMRAEKNMAKPRNNKMQRLIQNYPFTTDS